MLVLSPVPMVRGFGLLLAVGIAIAFVCALIVGSAALVLSGPRPSRGTRPRLAERSRRAVHCRESSSAVARGRAPAWRGARELLTDNPLTRLVSRTALDRAVRRPGGCSAVGLVLAALGWGLDTQTKVQTNIEKLVPQDTASLRNLNTLERLSGVGGVINLTIGGAGRAEAGDDRMDELV